MSDPDDILDTPMGDGTDSAPDCGVSYADICDAIKSRKEWEEKQTLFYKMRHNGTRRRTKPWAGAADMHYPLADTLIEKLKPYYFQQVFAGETIAGFYALKSENARFQSAAAQWFDYQLKQRSNFEEFLAIAVDKFCEGGRTPVRIRWDKKAQELRFEAPNNLDVIMPPWTTTPDEADWIVLVETWSVAAYKRESLFSQDKELIDRIKGKGVREGTAEENKTERMEREGITCAASDSEIILWTVHVRDGDTWRIRTVSPVCWERPVREDFKLPYAKGVFAKGASPFSQLSYELKETRYYSGRGVCEKVAAFEASLNKDWNTMKDWQELTTKPVFYAEKGLPNTGNISMRPGAVMPFKVEAIQFPPIPFDIANAMANTRSTAEQLVAIPDFGIGDSRAPGGKKTATEVQALSAVMGQNVELRSRIFRRELGVVLGKAWALLVQYAAESRDFFYQDQLGSLPVEALEDLYRIEPSGSGDNFNRELVVNKAYTRLQVLGNSPYIDQGELVKSALEADDPRLVRRLFRMPDQLAASQAEQQAQEISILLLGFPAALSPADDDATHFNTVVQFLQQRSMAREPIPPPALAAICVHALQHFEAMRQKKDPRAEQFGEEAAGLQRMATTAAQAMGQTQPQPAASAAPLP